jgi:hypothetical protein
MSPLFTYKGKLLQENNKLAISENCCCDKKEKGACCFCNTFIYEVNTQDFIFFGCDAQAAAQAIADEINNLIQQAAAAMQGNGWTNVIAPANAAASFGGQIPPEDCEGEGCDCDIWLVSGTSISACCSLEGDQIIFDQAVPPFGLNQLLIFNCLQTPEEKDLDCLDEKTKAECDEIEGIFKPNKQCINNKCPVDNPLP